MRHLPLAIIALLLMCACATRPKTTSTESHTDLSVLVERKADSLARTMVRHDSIMIKDSVYIWQRGDTVTQYVERWRVNYQTKHDTLVRYVLAADTVYRMRTDSVYVETPVIIEKPWKWYDQGFRRLGIVALLGLTLWVVWRILKRKL